MTERLYYDDSYTVEFSAQIVDRRVHEKRPAVILDRTCFYPTGGGQPHDTGSIGEARVVDVLTADEDGKPVLHVLDRDVSGGRVDCRVDWARRFDHMQHHTGQHILTQAFVQVAGASTVGFHLSPDSVTIDLDTTDLPEAKIAEAEDLANQIVQANRPVTATLIDPDNADHVRIRRIPPHLLTAGLRVIEVEGFDITACGGTHVARAGDIGLIKIIRLERRGEKTRVEFRCGLRALHDYRAKNQVILRLMADLNTRPEEIERVIGKLRDEAKEAQRALRAATQQLVDSEAERLLAGAAPQGEARLIKAAYAGRDVGELRALVSRLIQEPGMIVLAGTAGEKAQIMLARSADLALNMNEPLREALALLGAARGGGQPGFAQGGGVHANLAQVQAALDRAGQWLAARL